MEESLALQIKHLYEVEGLSQRQIVQKLHVSRKSVAALLREQKAVRPAESYLLKPYERLIAEWYKEYPFLKAIQVHERLKSYDFKGSYTTVKLYTRRYRKKRPEAFHELEFLPGEEAQVDWMSWKLGERPVYGFVFLLAWSRYVYVKFYPRHSFEFFLDGHIGAYSEIKGVAHRNRYDNLRSVIIERAPELRFNPQFLDFSLHYGFSIHVCNPQRANEKGRVERVIRDVKDFLRVSTFADLADLNTKVSLWRRERNDRVHRTTGRSPAEALGEEKLKPLPQIAYRPYRVVAAVISKTAFVEFETNRYSVPSLYAGMSCEILAFPESLEIVVKGRKVATHRREFERKEKRESPSHRERLLALTPQFKYQRIYQLMKGMAKEVDDFLLKAEQEGENPLAVAYELFKLLKGISRETLLSAIRQARSLNIYRTKYIHSLLQPTREPHPVHPQDRSLLEISYKRRNLDDYDDLL